MKSALKCSGGVAIYGDAYVDIIVAEGGSERENTIVNALPIRPGGSAGYLAAGLAALNVPHSLHAHIGDDDLGSFWKRGMQRLGVNTRSVEKVRGQDTGRSITFLVGPERYFTTQVGANEHPMEPISMDHLRGTEIVFLSGFLQAPGLWNERFLASLLEAKRAFSNLIIALDPNWDERGAKICLDLLPFLDLVFVNEEEARQLTGINAIETAIEKILGLGTALIVVVLKSREQGSWVASKRLVIPWYVPSYKVAVKDPNGAGNFFAAGFIAHLLQTKDPVRAAQFATKCAVAAIQHMALVNKMRAIGKLRLERKDKNA